MLFLLHFVGAAVFWDIRYGRIPNGLIAAGLLCGLAYQVFGFRWAGTIRYAAGIAVPVAVFGLLYYFRMMGAGDIKLLCVIGGYLGPVRCVSCIIFTILFGGIISAVLIFKRRNLYARLVYFKTYLFRFLETKQWEPYRTEEDKDSQFCFSIPIFMGLLCVLGGAC